MFGFGDFSIFAVFWLCILSAVLCVVYGVINWNKGADGIDENEAAWDEEEQKMVEKLDI